MRLKSFHGATLSEAMRLVRDALGDDAIIVATRDDEKGGVRVTAAIDDVVENSRSIGGVTAAPDGSKSLEDIAEALTRHQVAPTIAEKLMATATQFVNDDPQLALSAALDTHLKFEAINEEVPVMLVGPPGAGKTLCTAKFATKATLARQTPTVISTDLERAGGLEQLAAFTRLLKVNLVEIEDCHALRDVLTMRRNGPAFIDTSGANPFAAYDQGIVRDMIAAVGDATLVLPAGMDAAESSELAQEFQAIGAKRLLVTRLDTVRRLGSLIRLAYDTRLPLSSYCASPKVSEPPRPLNPVIIARMLLNAEGARAEATRTTAAAQAPAKSAYGA